jgi:hypothetical protein
MVEFLPDTTKMRSKDRVLVLSIMDDKKPKSSTGMVDTSLFTGGNKLHAKMEDETCFWYLKYDNGILPQPLKVKFTSFPQLKRHAEEYFKNRNIEIKEVID